MLSISKSIMAAVVAVPCTLAFVKPACADSISDTSTFKFTGPDANSTGTGLVVGNTTLSFNVLAPSAFTTSTPTTLTFGQFTTTSSDTAIQSFSSSDKFILTITQNGTATETVTASVSGGFDKNTGSILVTGFTPGSFTLVNDSYTNFSSTEVSPPSAAAVDTETADVTAPNVVSTGVPLPATASMGGALIAALGLGALAKAFRKTPAVSPVVA